MQIQLRPPKGQAATTESKAPVPQTRDEGYKFERDINRAGGTPALGKATALEEL